jgi:hypothetical protein
MVIMRKDPEVSKDEETIDFEWLMLDSWIVAFGMIQKLTGTLY